MSFETKYRLLEPLPDLSTHPELELLGREISSGQPVVVHLLSPLKPEVKGLMLRARSLPPDYASLVLETGEYKDTPYVVTKILPDNLTLVAWLKKVSAQSPGDTRLDALHRPAVFKAQSPSPSAPPLPPNLDKAAPGEFTSMFQAKLPEEQPTRTIEIPPELLQRIRSEPAEPPKPVQPAMKANVPPPAVEPGEFTRMFQAAQSPAIPVEPVPPKPTIPPLPAQPAAPAQNQPGEFTRMFQAGKPAAPPPVQNEPKPDPKPAALPNEPKPAAVPPPNEPGEFTQLFQAG
ncbi:MAG: hypothetical protein JO022_08085, partial [Acidobacteriaceae bacterium]|nr:hypothetical protein [Acidobacteriaceae bacterium]